MSSFTSRLSISGPKRSFSSSIETIQKASAETIHGSLLTFGELLRANKYMADNFDTICEIVIQFRQHKSKYIKAAVIELLPELAKFNPERFTNRYLKQSVEHIVDVLNRSKDHRDNCYHALGAIALAVGANISKMLSLVLELVKVGLNKYSKKAAQSSQFLTEEPEDGIGGSGGSGLGSSSSSSSSSSGLGSSDEAVPNATTTFHAALKCLSKLVCAVGVELQEPIRPLIDPMFSAGLSTTLVETLRNICTQIPSLKREIHALLALELWSILCMSNKSLEEVIQYYSYMLDFERDRDRDPLNLSNGNGNGNSNGNSNSNSHGHGHVGGYSGSSSSPRYAEQKEHDNVSRFDRARTLTVALLTGGSGGNNSSNSGGSGGGGGSKDSFVKKHSSTSIGNDKRTNMNRETMNGLVLLALRALADFELSLHFVLPFLHEIVLCYLEYENVTVRKQAAVTVGTMVLRIVSNINKISTDVFSTQAARHLNNAISDVMDKLLSVGMTDQSWTIRSAIFGSLHTPLDHHLGQSSALRALQLALNDEVFEVRKQVLKVLGRLAQRNPAQVIPYLRKTLTQLLTELQYSRDITIQQESAELLGILIDSCQFLLKPFAPAIARVMVAPLHQTMGDDILVETEILRCIGKLSEIAHEDMVSYVDILLPRMEKFLNDNWDIRREAMRALGILGAVDPFTYKIKMNKKGSNYNTSAVAAIDNNSSGNLKSQSDISLLDSRSEDYYPTVVVHSLCKMLADNGLRVYHYDVLRAIVDVLKHVGKSRCGAFLAQVMPILLDIMKQSVADVSHRQTLLETLITIISVCESHIRDYLDQVFEIVQAYWNVSNSTDVQLQSLLLQLLTQINFALGDELKVYLTDLIPLLLHVLHSDKSAERTSSLHVLQALETFGSSLEDLLYLVIPPLMKIIEHTELNVSIRIRTIECISKLCRCVNFSSFFSRAIHPLIRIIDDDNDQLRGPAAQALCSLLVQMGPDYAIFIPNIDKILKKHKAVSGEFTKLADRLIRNGNDPMLDSDVYTDGIDDNGSGGGSNGGISNGGGGGGGGKGEEAMDTNDSLSTGKDRNAGNLAADNGRNGDGAEPSETGHNGNLGDDSNVKLSIQSEALHKVVKRWNADHTFSKEDWIEWLKSLQIELLKQSPALLLRLCVALAQRHDPLASELFNAAYLSCWTELEDWIQDKLIQVQCRAFTEAQSKPGSVPNEVLLTLLNLTEFMDRQGHGLPVGETNLGKVAEICHSYAKALYYKEKEFRFHFSNSVAPLIEINNRLQQTEAAEGLVEFAQHRQQMEVFARWFENLHRWEDALDAYEKKQMEKPMDVESTVGRMRCHAALGHWNQLHALAIRNVSWDGAHKSDANEMKGLKHSSPRDGAAGGGGGGRTGGDSSGYHNLTQTRQSEMAALGAMSAWSLQKWEDMTSFTQQMSEDEMVADTWFYRAILAVHNKEYKSALEYIDRTREALDGEMTALVGESYNRAYDLCVRLQQLAEMEEIVYMQTHVEPQWKQRLKHVWAKRLNGCQKTVAVWQKVLSVRQMAISPREDVDTWLKFSSLCRKNGHLVLDMQTLSAMLNETPEYCLRALSTKQFPELYAKAQSTNSDIDSAKITFSLAKHCWSAGMHDQAKDFLHYLITELTKTSEPRELNIESAYSEMVAKCYVKLGVWAQESTHDLNDNVISQATQYFNAATQHNTSSYWGWHDLAVMHYEAINRNNTTHVVAAVTSLFQSIALDHNTHYGTRLQDILRLLQVWFNHGNDDRVSNVLRNGFNTVPVETWLAVIPQIIARLPTASKEIATLIEELLSKVGKQHPQSLVYPLAVASKSAQQKKGANSNEKANENELLMTKILNRMRGYSPFLVAEAFMVSDELIRAAILWDERWYEALETASRLYFGEKDPKAMLAQVDEMHEVMKQGATTLNEIAFEDTYGRDLAEAREWCQRYRVTGNESDLNQAWEYYAFVFRQISQHLPNLKHLELQYVSPKLQKAQDLQLAVPGTYNAHKDTVSISAFQQSLRVIDSKQRPRRIVILGSDGKEYAFLLKGHEDLRLDERVMQLFGLVNTLLRNENETRKRGLAIRAYSVIPLSPTSGVLEWMPNTDTLHSLIKEYRESHKMLNNIENILMHQMAPDFAKLCLMPKVEVFEYVLRHTSGKDLQEMLWLKSASAEVWLERRTEYVRSLAVMSMVGYILGLGDRHPSNLMMDKYSGKLIHIDFGDCFEVTMQRDKFPEKFPFRLTRMLINAMEVSGIEGNYRITCEAVMSLLRTNKESIQAVMEAFAYDPLINWRLLTTDNDKQPQVKPKHKDIVPSESLVSTLPSTAQARPNSFVEQFEHDESINQKAVTVLKRLSQKLRGRDFDDGKEYTVNEQVQRLILDATSHENLCQAYLGWCPLW
ncbi:phosphatidylinositol kinase Tor2 [Reticulomyxa filosa]|uniref:Serine/threonine-protein kinase TOR n=1 Tax=Reticulomyxa filosa TaxID=46433 RepID=X6NQP0_RETFI|nr:phosphatidylinositol kinase Tor2 [Reticulomyxa filosa]|eukprot:ETO28610.1 phosphatidylinositol kinase Tor2 [Reticulomyxa filosa]